MADVGELSLMFHNSRYDDDDPRWRAQVGDLVGELRREAGPTRVARTPVAGTKGTVDQLILTLGSAGVIDAAVALLRAWLARDKHRSVEITVTGPDRQPTSVVISAENAGADAVAPLIAAASGLAREG
jgi:Effector Associated Constant Component 1